MLSYQTGAPGAPLLEAESEPTVPHGTAVLIKTVACGVRHSDLHLRDGGFELGGCKVLNYGREGHGGANEDGV